MRRGDLDIVAIQGDFENSQPALVIQADLFTAHSSVTVLMVNAPLLRISIQPDSVNGLQKPSQSIMDKALTVKRDKIGQTFGSVCWWKVNGVLLFS